ncbi:MAG: acyl carrier protein [Rhodospirillales bacterium]|nr:acyl carrier protein [Alphaproteobacteria bacterium LMO-S08]WND74970.1 acyl carrier protein [Thalassospiraceae bacterium LMO-SO8]|tara:strand:- start:24530 stop:24775 length:246 start_codon:yes stop_codon:yes gene_type:complete
MTGNETRLKGVIADILKIDAAIIGEDTSVDTVEQWDSLRHLNLVLALEAEFDISFTEEQTVEILNYPLIRIVLEEHGIAFT